MKSAVAHGLFSHLKDDIPAGIVVFLVAMPLCLGIALASGAPLFAGIISGVIGGIVVGSFSGSPLGVSGPAAGLAVIVLTAITDLGGFDVFLVAVILAGILQLVMGFARAGLIAPFFPSSVISGMLAGIGVLIFLKQIPHAFGYDADPEGDFEFLQMDGYNTFDELIHMVNFISPEILIISVVSLVILVAWETKFMKGLAVTKLLQGPLVAVVVGITLNVIFATIPGMEISADHLVSIPIIESADGLIASMTFPNLSALSNPAVYTTAVFIAIVASLETLLCVEASDKQDTLKRITPTNRELKAQGIGNIIAGFLGGLPVTQVIVRTSANQQSGGRTKLSTIFHGILLLISVALIPQVLNLIPYGVLAAILLVVGYKLAKPSLFKKMYSQGASQFVPFVVTILGIVFTDLLMGIGLGLIVAIFIILRDTYKVPYNLHSEIVDDEETITLSLSENVTFLNKAYILEKLASVPDDAHLIVDARQNHYVHHDVVVIIEDFVESAAKRNIRVEVLGIHDA